MSSTTPLTDAINALTTRVNGITGASDTTLSDAVDSLIDGYTSATAHTIYFEFTDETDTTITAYYDGTFISDAIRATVPTTYGAKTVASASLDNVTWYTRSTETWEVIYNNATTHFEPDEGYTYPYCWISELGDVEIVPDSVWRVTFENVEYRCTALQGTIESGTYTYIGNPKWADAFDNDVDVPFLLYSTPWGAWLGNANVPNVSSNYSLKVERLVTS